MMMSTSSGCIQQKEHEAVLTSVLDIYIRLDLFYKSIYVSRYSDADLFEKMTGA